MKVRIMRTHISALCVKAGKTISNFKNNQEIIVPVSDVTVPGSDVLQQTLPAVCGHMNAHLLKREIRVARRRTLSGRKQKLKDVIGWPSPVSPPISLSEPQSLSPVKLYSTFSKVHRAITTSCWHPHPSCSHTQKTCLGEALLLITHLLWCIS